jgi:hypothetical protein
MLLHDVTLTIMRCQLRRFEYLEKYINSLLVKSENIKTRDGTYYYYYMHLLNSVRNWIFMHALPRRFNIIFIRKRLCAVCKYTAV